MADQADQGDPMSTEALERAFAATRGVLQNVKQDQLDDPTPCESWKVRDLIDHIVSGSVFFGMTMDAGEGTDPKVEVDDARFVDQFDEGVKGTVASFKQPGALEKNVKLPFGEFTGEQWMNLATTDTFTHGWDLARATKQSSDLDPRLAQQLLQGAEAFISDEIRGDDGVMPFAHKCDAPADASPADQLAAFLGRSV